MKSAYNKIAQTYLNLGDRFGSFSRSHDTAFKQIIEKGAFPQNSALRIVDLGVGNGTFLARLDTHFQNADFTGFDISEEMLKIAQKNLPQMQAVRGSASFASSHLKKESQSLVLAHFINAYVSSEVLFSQAKTILEPNGLFSYIGTSEESFSELKTGVELYISRNSISSCLLAHFYRRAVKKTLVPHNALNLMQDSGFDVVSNARLEIPVRFDSVDEFMAFGVDGSWFLNAFNVPIVPDRIIAAGLRYFVQRVFQFPLETRHVIDVVLGRKISG